MDASTEEVEINKFYDLIGNRSDELEKIYKAWFESTSLHEAASAGQTSFAMEVMNLMPSFSRKLNKDGLSPMHLALSKGHSELVLLLLRADPQLVRVKGKGGMTPLHYATQIGNTHILAYFLVACPESIEDVTTQSETVFHIAVKYDKLEALEVLVGWFRRVCHKNVSNWERNIPNWRNKEGRTVLDIAVQPSLKLEAIQLLAEIKAKNSKGKTVLDALQDQTDLGKRVLRQMLSRNRASKASLLKSTKTVANYLRSNIGNDEKVAVYFTRIKMSIDRDLRNAGLVVAGVILAATLQAVFSPPGGVGQENSTPNIVINGTSINTTISNTIANVTGKSVMGVYSFMDFSIYNSLMFRIVVGVVVFLLSGVLGRILFVVLTVLSSLYTAAIMTISPNSVIGVVNMSLVSFLFLFLYSIMIIYDLGNTKLLGLCYDANQCPKEAVGDEVQESRVTISP